jgi:biotin operon repressor
MSTSKTTEPASTTKIRIVFQGECNKLTARGQGKLSYELGVDDTTDENFIRIAGNSQGGTCSFEWINLQTIENMMDYREPEEINFNAILFQKAFISRSANNHGYLAAILKAENVIGHALEQSSQLTGLSFDGIKEKIQTLQKEGIDLLDHIAGYLI